MRGYLLLTYGFDGICTLHPTSQAIACTLAPSGPSSVRHIRDVYQFSPGLRERDSNVLTFLWTHSVVYLVYTIPCFACVVLACLIFPSLSQGACTRSTLRTSSILSPRTTFVMGSHFFWTLTQRERGGEGEWLLSHSLFFLCLSLFELGVHVYSWERKYVPFQLFLPSYIAALYYFFIYRRRVLDL